MLIVESYGIRESKLFKKQRNLTTDKYKHKHFNQTCTKVFVHVFEAHFYGLKKTWILFPL